MSGLYLAGLFAAGIVVGLLVSWFVEKKYSPYHERNILGMFLLSLGGVEYCLHFYYSCLSLSELQFSSLSMTVGMFSILISGGGAAWLLPSGKIFITAVMFLPLTLIYQKGIYSLASWCMCLGISVPLFLQACMQSFSHDKPWGKNKTIKTYNWFQCLTGCDEEEFRKDPSKFIQPAHVPVITATATTSASSLSSSSLSFCLVIVNQKNKTKYHAGRFSLISFEQLRSEVLQSSMINREAKREGKDEKKGTGRRVPIDLVCKVPSDQQSRLPEAKWRRDIDVASQQAEKKSRDAVFQVASNFNGIEAIRESSFPEDPNFARNYYSDLTQGPAASISAGAGAITRIYAPFYDQNTPPHTWAQTRTRQINFLEHLSEFFPVQNGYVVLTKPERSATVAETQETKRISAPSLPVDEKELSLLQDKVLVAYHHQIEVTTGHRPRGHDYAEVVEGGEQRVDQVLCAALNLGQGLEGRYNRSCPNAEIKAKFLLKVAYEGAYLSAIRHRRTQLNLTLIGGGVFNNPHDWIIEAIVAAHEKWSQHEASTIQRVILNLHTNEYLLGPIYGLLLEHNIESTSGVANL